MKDWNKYIILIYKKVVELFPKSTPAKYGFEEYSDEPTSMMIMEDLAYWLKEVDCTSQEVIQKVKEFSDYCMKLADIQAEKAEDKEPFNHIYTDYIVAFFETLFRDKNRQQLIPYIRKKEDLINNRDYYIQWVGKDNYLAVLELYKKEQIPK